VGGARGRARSGRCRPARTPHRRGAAAPRARRRRAALAEADVVVEATYRTQTVLHNSLETHQALCEWQGDTLHVYISTQFIWGIRQAVADSSAARGQGARRLRVHGRRLRLEERPDEYTFVAAELAKRTGRPVRCALTRREEHTSPATATRPSSGSGRRRSDGTIVAFDGEFTNSVGWSGWNAGTEGPMQMLYDCENVRTIRYSAKLNTPPMKRSALRASSRARSGLECLIDELAAKLDMDGLELRRRNYASSNDGTPYSSKNLMQCYALAQKHWDRRHEVRLRSNDTWKHGVGMASQIWYGGGGPPSYAWGALDVGRPPQRDHRDAGHRTGTRYGDGADRGRGARRSAGPCGGGARRLCALGRTRRSRPAPRPCRRWDRRCARPRPMRSGR
jgi:xanthine dehydrogenase YagR molybdenum-binding subunit